MREDLHRWWQVPWSSDTVPPLSLSLSHTTARPHSAGEKLEEFRHGEVCRRRRRRWHKCDTISAMYVHDWLCSGPACAAMHTPLRARRMLECPPAFSLSFRHDMFCFLTSFTRLSCLPFPSFHISWLPSCGAIPFPRFTSYFLYLVPFSSSVPLVSSLVSFHIPFLSLTFLPSLLYHHFVKLFHICFQVHIYS